MPHPQLVRSPRAGQQALLIAAFLLAFLPPSVGAGSLFSPPFPSYPTGDHPIAAGDFNGDGKNGGWTVLSPAGGPPTPCDGHSAIYDPVRARMIAFGGGLDGVWSLALSGALSWSQLTPTGSAPPAVGDHSGIYDAPNDRLIVFGGQTAPDQLTSEVWSLPLGGAGSWTDISPSGTPPTARTDHSAVYDPLRSRMIVFGGTDGAAAHNDTWTLSLSGVPTWSQLLPMGTPPGGRYGQSMVYDPVGDRVLVFAGYNFAGGGDNYMNDVWQLSLSGTPTWTQLAPTNPPPGSYGHIATYDPVRRQMIVFGGYDHTFRSDTWALNLSGPLEWVQLTPPGSTATGLYNASCIYDPTGDRLLLFGGDNPANQNTLWALTLGQTAVFQPRVDYPVGSRSLRLAIGDLNSDGHPDVVATDYLLTGGGDGNTVSVLLGNGDGTLGARAGYAVGAMPAAVAIADFDGDGRKDLATANYGDNTVSILLGNGDGTFEPQSAFSIGSNSYGAYGLAVGDLNADGREDVAVTGVGDSVYVLLGGADGGLLRASGFQVPGSTEAIVIGDFNADGRPDVAAAGTALFVLLGNGDGTLGPVTRYEVPTDDVGLATGDLNGDGRLDLALTAGAVSPSSENRVWVLLGSGDGTFSSSRDFTTAWGPTSVAIADLNGDGHPDLVTSHAYAPTPEFSDSLTVLLGNGDGTFGWRTDLVTGSGPYTAVAGDLDSDGRPDLVTANYGANTISVFLNGGQGIFPLATPLQFVASVLCPSRARLTWQDNSANESRFEIQVQVDNAGPWTDAVSLQANSQQWTSGVLTLGHSYGYRIRACAGSTCSAWSGIASAAIPPPLGVPGMPTVTNLGTSTSLRIAWDPVPGANSYLIARSDGTFSANLPAQASPYEDSGLSRGTTYTYTVAAVNMCGVGPFSAPVSRAPDYYPLLLVHGFHGNEGTFTDCGKINALFPCDGIEAVKLGDALYQGGLQRISTVEYSMALGLAGAAEIVRRRIDEICPEGNGEKIQLVAHSQGGLVCRYVIQNMGYSGRVDRLVMLSTPNHGTDLALYKFLVDAGEEALPPAAAIMLDLIFGLVGRDQIEDLIPGSEFLDQLNYGEGGTRDLPAICASRSAEQLGGPTKYWLVHGTGGWCFNAGMSLRTLLPPLASAAVEATLCSPNDGVVETASGTDGDLVALPEYFKRWDIGLDVHNPRIRASHNDAAAGTCPNVRSILKHNAVISFVHQIVTGTVPSPAENVSFANRDRATDRPLAIPPEPETPLREIGRARGTLAGVGARHDQLLIDSVREAWFVQSGTAGDMTFEVWSPGGRRITPADTTGGDVTYFANLQLNLQAIVVKAPEAGEWQAVSSGPDQTYAVQALAVTDTLLKTEVDSGGPPGQSTVRCWMEGGAGPLLGAQVTGLEVRPDSTSAPLQFYDDGSHGDGVAGDGVFGASVDLSPAGPHAFWTKGTLAPPSSGTIARNGLAISVTEALADLSLNASNVTVSDVGPGNDSLNVSVLISNDGARNAEGVVLGLFEIGGSPIRPPPPFAVAAGGVAVVTARWLPVRTDSTVLQVFVDRLTPVTQSRYDNDTATVIVYPSVLAVARPSAAVALSLGHPYPNPARGDVSIEFALPTRAQVALNVFDIAGRRIRTLYDGVSEPGPHLVRWNRQQGDGRRVGPGIYFYELRVDGHRLTRRVVALR